MKVKCIKTKLYPFIQNIAFIAGNFYEVNISNLELYLYHNYDSIWVSQPSGWTQGFYIKKSSYNNRYLSFKEYFDFSPEIMDNIKNLILLR